MCQRIVRCCYVIQHHPRTLTPSHATCGLLGIVKLPSAASLQNAILDLGLRHFKSPGQCKSIKCTNVTDVDMFLKIKCNLSPISSQLMHQEISTSHHQLISESGLLSIVNQFNVTRVGIHLPNCSLTPIIALPGQGSVCNSVTALCGQPDTDAIKQRM